jgi:integrase
MKAKQSTAVKLTVAAVAKLKADRKRRLEILDALGPPGMYLVIQPSGAKSWVLRFKQAGQRYKLFIGTCDTSTTGKKTDALELRGHHTLANARVLARKYHALVAAGRNPVTERKVAKAQAAFAMIDADKLAFPVVAREYVEHQLRDEKEYRGWDRTAGTLGLAYDGDTVTVIPGSLCARWASRSVSEITRAELKMTIRDAGSRGVPGRGMSNSGHSSARERRVSNALGGLFAWCVGRGNKLEANPMTGIEKPEPSGERDRVLSDDELKTVWLASDEMGKVFGPLIKLLILTGQRIGETSGMMRGEIKDGEWTIPGTRTKNGKTHIVPLSAPAREIVEDRLAGDCDLMFTTTKRRPVSGMSKMKARLDRLAGLEEEWKLHDLRRTMATGLQKLGVALPVTEAVLNHVSGSRSGIVGVYQRHDYAKEKRAAMERWGRRVEAIIEGRQEETVVPMRKA